MALAVAATCAGCDARNGDFGRHKPGLMATITSEFSPSLTSVEQELRNRAVHFRIVDSMTRGAGAEARFNALSDRIRNDHVLLLAFGQSMRDVRDKDRIRLTAAGAFSEINEKTKRESRERASANELVIAEVCLASNTRARDYRRELETLVISVPEREALNVERGLTLLEPLISQHCEAGASQPSILPQRQPASLDDSGKPLIIKR